MVDFPRFAANKGRSTLWLRQSGDTAERTPEAIRQTVIDYGYGGIAPKVADGMRYQALNDPTGATPYNGLDAIEAARDFYAAAGLVFVPVVVPRYWQPGQTNEPTYAPPTPEAQGEFHGAIARLCGCLVTDTEPYTPGFWGYAQELIPRYAAALRRNAGDAYLINQPDPRYYGRTDGKVQETAQYYDAIMAQHYVGWAGANWLSVATELLVLDQIAALGRDLYVTLYGVERVDLARQFGEQAANTRAVLGYNVFAMGPMNADQLRTLSGIDLSVAPEPIPFTQPQPEPEPQPQPEPPAPAPAPAVAGLPLDEARQWLDDDVISAETRRSLRAARLNEIERDAQ